ncbi:MAG: amidohydrolase [Lachnospiraceae bacterium]|nr:amidohydrolase [Lachnospiraceae bacterium]
MKKIALEEHFETALDRELDKEAMKDFVFPMTADAERGKYLADLFDLPFEEHRFPVMDRGEIAVQIISPNCQAVQFAHDSKRAVEMAVLINDEAAELAAGSGGRLKAFAVLPMQDPAAAAAELEKRVKEQGFVGAFVQGQTGLGDYPYYDDPVYDPVRDKLEELDLPFYIHPRNPKAEEVQSLAGREEMLANTWNWGYVTGTLALRMVFGGVFAKHPGLKVIIGHMGETIPYVLARLDEGFTCRGLLEKGALPELPSYYIKKNIYITTSGGWNPETMRCAISAIGADHIMFAADYPHFVQEQAISQIEGAGLSEEEMAAICWQNAERILHL